MGAFVWRGFRMRIVDDKLLQRNVLLHLYTMAVSVMVLYNCQGLAFSGRKAKMFRKVLWLIPGVDSFSLFYGLLSGLGSLLRMVSVFFVLRQL